MMLSRHAIESMGFTPIRPDDTIEATFHSLHIFEVRGFTLKDSGIVSHKAFASGTDYTIAVSQSVNEICSAIVGDAYAEDEAAWAQEHKCTPPYVVVHFGPTSIHAVTQGHAKTDGTEIITYGAFGAAREELHRLEARHSPRLNGSNVRIFVRNS